MKSLSAGFLAVTAALAVSSCVQPDIANQERFIKSFNEGTVALKNESYDQAQRAFEKCVEIAESFGQSDPKLSQALINLADIKCAEGQLDEALKLAERACDLVQKRLTADLSSRENMSICVDLGQYLAVKAKILGQKKNVFASRKAYQDSLHYLDTGMVSQYQKYLVIRAMTDMLKENGFKQESEMVLAQNEEIAPAPGMSSAANETKPVSWKSAFDAAYEAQEGGNFAKAKELYEAAVRFAVQKTIEDEKDERGRKISKNSTEFSQDYMHLAQSLRGLGVVLEAAGDISEAEKLQRRALSILENNSLKDAKENTLVLARLCSICARKRDFQSAARYGDRALKSACEVDAHDKFARNERKMLAQLSTMYVEQKKYDAAIKLLERKLALEKAAYHKPSEKFPQACDALASVQVKAGKIKEAEQSYQAALAYCHDVSVEVSEVESNVMEHYADLLMAEGRTKEAEDFSKQVKEFRGQTKSNSTFSKQDQETGPDLEKLIVKP